MHSGVERSGCERVSMRGSSIVANVSATVKAAKGVAPEIVQSTPEQAPWCPRWEGRRMILSGGAGRR
jgi:hypothetical protein